MLSVSIFGLWFDYTEKHPHTPFPLLYRNFLCKLSSCSHSRTWGNNQRLVYVATQFTVSCGQHCTWVALHHSSRKAYIIGKKACHGSWSPQKGRFEITGSEQPWFEWHGVTAGESAPASLTTWQVPCLPPPCRCTLMQVNPHTTPRWGMIRHLGLSSPQGMITTTPTHAPGVWGSLPHLSQHFPIPRLVSLTLPGCRIKIRLVSRCLHSHPIVA